MYSKSFPHQKSPPGMWISKLILRIVQIIINLAMIGLVGSMMSSGLYGIGSLIITAPTICLSIIWAFGEGLCIFLRGGRRGIHPGANVALDLILWLAFIGTAISLYFVAVLNNFEAENPGSLDHGVESGSGSQSSSSRASSAGSSDGNSASRSGGYSSSPPSPSPSPSGSGSYSGPYSRSSTLDDLASHRAGSGFMGSFNPCAEFLGGRPVGSPCVIRRATSNYEEDIQKAASSGNALAGLAAFLFFLHFVTFVIACVETHQRRRRRHTASLTAMTLQNAAINEAFGAYYKMQNESQAQLQGQSPVSVHNTQVGQAVPTSGASTQAGWQPVQVNGLPQTPSPTYQQYIANTHPEKTRYQIMAGIINA